MNIKAIIPAGLTEITVNGLHQWDYGRKLEIHSSDLPALIEVHFACAGMTEAVVRSCSVKNGVATAAIPDRCLEQTTPITAWVYALDGSSGATTAKINLVIEPRTRPCPSQEIPEDIADKYTEAVGAMNAAVEAFTEDMNEAVASVAAGNVTVARAIADANGNNIPNTYAKISEVIGEQLNTDICAKVKELTAAYKIGTYIFRLGGANYETDDNGQPVNLPVSAYKYSFATIYAYGNSARVYLWGNPWAVTPIYYRTYKGDEDKWSEWIEVVDSANIGNHTTNLVQRADMVYSMKKTLSSVQLDTEYVLGTMPADLWGDGGSYIDPDESVLKVVVRLHDPDVEMTASSGTNATKQAYQLQGFWWNPDNIIDTHEYRHYLATAVIWRTDSDVRIKFTSMQCLSLNSGEAWGVDDVDSMTVRVDFHRAVTK